MLCTMHSGSYSEGQLTAREHETTTTATVSTTRVLKKSTIAAQALTVEKRDLA